MMRTGVNPVTQLKAVIPGTREHEEKKMIAQTTGVGPLGGAGPGGPGGPGPHLGGPHHNPFGGAGPGHHLGGPAGPGGPHLGGHHLGGLGGPGHHLGGAGPGPEGVTGTATPFTNSIKAAIPGTKEHKTKKISQATGGNLMGHPGGPGVTNPTTTGTIGKRIKAGIPGTKEYTATHGMGMGPRAGMGVGGPIV